MNKIKYILSVLFVSTFLFASSCSDGFFDVDNTGIITDDDIAALDSAGQVKVAKALVEGMYAMNQYAKIWNSHEDFGYMSIMLKSDLMTDDIALRQNTQFGLDYSLSYWGEEYVKSSQNWMFFYNQIARANSVITALDLNTTNPEIKAYLGQAYAMRGMSLFYIAQTFQQTYVGNENAPGVPIIIAEKEGPSDNSRSTLTKVYQQIDADFIKSLDLLQGWVSPSKVYIDENIAAGLYSRVCLVKNDWTNAIRYARQGKAGRPVATLAQIRAEKFNDISSVEWMWGADITTVTTTKFASFFSHMCSYDDGYARPGFKLIDASLHAKLGLKDVRRYNQFINPDSTYTELLEVDMPDYTNIKFKSHGDWEADYVYMRISEMVLTEAEALAHQGNGAAAATILRELMAQRDTTWNKGTVTVDDVYTQRRLELWGEGFALFDHLRLKKGITRNYAGTNHLSGRRLNLNAGSWFFLYQLPLRELNNNMDIDKSEQNPSPEVAG